MESVCSITKLWPFRPDSTWVWHSTARTPRSLWMAKSILADNQRHWKWDLVLQWRRMGVMASRSTDITAVCSPEPGAGLDSSECEWHYLLIIQISWASLSGRTSYRKISWSLEVSRFGFKLFQLLWNLTGTSAAALPRCLSIFRTIRWL